MLHATGRVGRMRADLHVRRTGDLMLVRCKSNPHFWLDVDIKRRVASGALPPDFTDGATVAGEDFTVDCRNGRIRVDHIACPPFWLEIEDL